MLLSILKIYFKAITIVKEQMRNANRKFSRSPNTLKVTILILTLISHIADHFNITPSYLSKKFREECGISIIDYLYKIRISHSLKLIKDTSLKIADVAQMVGFQDSNAFIRIFKKYYGCTPGKYKTSSMELTNFAIEKVL